MAPPMLGRPVMPDSPRICSLNHSAPLPPHHSTPAPTCLRKRLNLLIAPTHGAAADEVARRLTSRSHPHKSGLRQRRKHPKLAHSALARTTHGALSEKAACATFNVRAVSEAYAPETRKRYAVFISID